MNKGQKTAKHFLELGLNPVPVSKDSKEPERSKWSTPMTEDEIEDFDFDSIGVCTGLVSGGLEAIDFDLKNASDPDFIMKTFKSKISLSLLKRLVVQKTVSGGFHMIYRCEDTQSSRKLAKNDKGHAVIETRGEGGYIKCAPSEGYELIQGSIDKIPIITPEERLQLFISAKMLNAMLIKDAKKKLSREDNDYIKKFQKYNEDIEVGIELLEEHGWTIHDEDDTWVNFTRPDSISQGLHGGYNKEGKFFYCFSTAQDTFEVERPYNNHAIYAELECGGNYRKAYAKLYEMGMGDEEVKPKKSKEAQEDEDWEDDLENLSFLSDEEEENSYLEQAIKGEIAQGLTTGWACLDEHFLIKPNSVNFGLGYDNVGKSVLMLNIAASTAVIHDWKWGMILPENRTAMSRRRLIEILSGKPITWFKYHPDEYAKYEKMSREYFKIVKNKKHYTIDDVLEMGAKMYEKFGIKALLIDPYNFFKVSGDGYKHNNDMLSKMRVFAEQYCAIYVMAHPRSDSPRSGKDQLGYLKAPSKYDIQGGADFPYRVDDFFIVHRIVNHSDPNERRLMQFIVEKIKETETGGEVHEAGEYTGLMWEKRNGFLGYWDDDGNNPFYERFNVKQEVKEKLKRISPEEAF